MQEDFDERFDSMLEKFLKADIKDLELDDGTRTMFKWRWLNGLIPGIIVTSAGGLLPFQAEGLLKGYPFYYRERGGVASLEVASKGSPNAYSVNPLYSAYLDVEEFRESGLHWVETFLNLVKNLEKSPFLYMFEGDEIFFNPDDKEDMYTDGTKQIYHAWGGTPEEAYAGATDLEDAMEFFHGHYKWPKEMVERHNKLQNIQPEPLNCDVRVFSDPEPTFEVTAPESWINAEGYISIPESFWLEESE